MAPQEVLDRGKHQLRVRIFASEIADPLEAAARPLRNVAYCIPDPLVGADVEHALGQVNSRTSVGARAFGFG